MLLPYKCPEPIVDLYPARWDTPRVGLLDIGFVRKRDAWIGKTIAALTNGYWSHVFLGYNPVDNIIVESLEWGVEFNHVNRYKEHDVAILRISEMFDPTDPRFIEAARFMDSVAEDPTKEHYGYVQIASILASIIGQGVRERFGLTGESFYFGKGGTNICSGFAAETLERLGYAPDVPGSHQSPNGLGLDWSVPYSDEHWRRS